MVERSVEVDFVRFLGRKSESDEDGKTAHVSVGQGKLGLKPDASLLAVSNHFGALFAGTKTGFRWCWMADLHQQCSSGGAEATFQSVQLRGAPFMLTLSPGDEALAVLTADGDATAVFLHVVDVSALLQGRHALVPSFCPRRCRALTRLRLCCQP